MNTMSTTYHSDHGANIAYLAEQSHPHFTEEKEKEIEQTGHPTIYGTTVT